MISLVVSLFSFLLIQNNNQSSGWWPVQSIDTVKYSRDLARIKSSDSAFSQTIDQQIKIIAETGSNYVALGTPYDQEFIPFLKEWINSARKYNLHVWFRGNFSGWEGWFNYQPITPNDHIKMTSDFILNNQDLFENGDIFTACTECENGVIGDPRFNGDLNGFRQFMIDEYQTTKNDFKKINKSVRSNYNSMNGDVALLVMDKPTTLAMDGIVAIDHYVNNSEKLREDIDYINKTSGGNIVLSEFGAPISDIHGDMDENQQAEWVNQSLKTISDLSNVEGVNYWTNEGSSTALWNEDGSPKKVVSVITNFYKPLVLEGKILNEINQPISDAQIYLSKNYTRSNKNGYFSIPYVDENSLIKIYKSGYMEQIISHKEFAKTNSITLIKYPENFLFKIEKLFHSIYTRSWK